MVQTRSLLRPLFSPLPCWQGEGGSAVVQTSPLCSTWGLHTGTHKGNWGTGDIWNTVTHHYTKTFHLASLSWEYIFSVSTKGKSLTALTLAGNSLVLFITQDTQKGRGREKEKKRKKRHWNLTLTMPPTCHPSGDVTAVGWSVSRLVGGLRHWTEAFQRLWFSKSASHHFFLMLFQSIPQCLQDQQHLRPSHLVLVTFFFFFFKHWSQLPNCNFIPVHVTDYINALKSFILPSIHSVRMFKN